MTLVRFASKAPTPEGDQPARSVLRFTPTKRRLEAGDPGVVIGHSPFTVKTPGTGPDTGRVDVPLAATGPDWAWKVEEYIVGSAGTVMHVQVPDSEDPVDYTSLVQVDPYSLDPLAEPDPTWYGALETVQVTAAADATTKANAAQAAAIAAASSDATAKANAAQAAAATDATTKANAVLTAAAADATAKTEYALTVAGEDATAKANAAQAAAAGDATAKANAAQAAAVEEVSPALLPAGGTTGQVLRKTSGTDFAAVWVDAAAAMPAGGVLSVSHTGTEWPARPTARTDIRVDWLAPVDIADPSGAINGDLRVVIGQTP